MNGTLHFLSAFTFSQLVSSKVSVRPAVSVSCRGMILSTAIGKGEVISDKIYICDSKARLRMWNYQVVVRNCRQPFDFNMKLFVAEIAPSIRPLPTKMQVGLARPNLPQWWGRSEQAVG